MGSQLRKLVLLQLVTGARIEMIMPFQSNQDVIQRKLLEFNDYIDEKIPVKVVPQDVRIFHGLVGARETLSEEETPR